MYAGGWGIPKDDFEALQVTAEGVGVDEDAAQDYAKAQLAEALSDAAFWYKKAAEQGHAEAQYGLVTSYCECKGYISSWSLPRDDAEMVAWCRKAAEQGHEDAQYHLGCIYKAGTAVPRDLVKAHAWFSLADQFYFETIAARKMTCEQLTEARELSRELTKRISGNS